MIIQCANWKLSEARFIGPDYNPPDIIGSGGLFLISNLHVTQMLSVHVHVHVHVLIPESGCPDS